MKCPTCLDSFSSKNHTVTTECGHLFHEDCYLNYLQAKAGANALCPNCRTPIDKEAVKKVEITAPTPKVEDDDPFAAGANP